MAKSMIVCVDDEQIVLNSLNTQLTRKFGDQYHYEFAESGEEALEIIEEMEEEGFRLVMIISDHIMPGMKGDELLVEVHNKYPNAIKIMLTGQAALESAVKAINQADLYRYLIKPWEEEDFLLTVEKGLKQYSMQVLLGELAEALQLREDLANTIVHDFRTPLNLIQGYSQLLLMQDNVSQEFAQYLAEVQKQTDRLTGFTNDLLMLAKMENQQVPLELSTIDGKQWLASMEQEYKILAESQRVEFTMKMTGESRQITLDQKLFQRVIDNLLNNSFKFSPDGAPVTLHVEFLEGEKSLRLEVCDQGPGIPDSHKNSVFDKFKIIEMKKKGVSQVGLGLVFCKMVIDAHKGTIMIKDNQPKGSIFIVEI